MPFSKLCTDPVYDREDVVALLKHLVSRELSGGQGLDEEDRRRRGRRRARRRARRARRRARRRAAPHRVARRARRRKRWQNIKSTGFQILNAIYYYYFCKKIENRVKQQK